MLSFKCLGIPNQSIVNRRNLYLLREDENFVLFAIDADKESAIICLQGDPDETKENEVMQVTIKEAQKKWKYLTDKNWEIVKNDVLPGVVIQKIIAWIKSVGKWSDAYEKDVIMSWRFSYDGIAPASKCRISNNSNMTRFFIPKRSSDASGTNYEHYEIEHEEQQYDKIYQQILLESDPYPSANKIRHRKVGEKYNSNVDPECDEVEDEDATDQLDYWEYKEHPMKLKQIEDIRIAKNNEDNDPRNLCYKKGIFEYEIEKRDEVSTVMEFVDDPIDDESIIKRLEIDEQRHTADVRWLREQE